MLWRAAPSLICNGVYFSILVSGYLLVMAGLRAPKKSRSETKDRINCGSNQAVPTSLRAPNFRPSAPQRPCPQKWCISAAVVHSIRACVRGRACVRACVRAYLTGQVAIVTPCCQIGSHAYLPPPRPSSTLFASERQMAH